MNIFHCNIRSLSTKKLEELEANLATIDKKYELVVCMECWFNEDKTHLLNLKGYRAVLVSEL